MRRTTKQRLGALIAFVCSCAVVEAQQGAGAEQDVARSGFGWVMTGLDLDITVDPGAQRMEYDGEMRLRLENLEESYGPALYVNLRLNENDEPVMRFVDVRAEAATVTIRDQLINGKIGVADVEYGEPMARGDEISVSFRCASHGYGDRMAVFDSIALAGWTGAWHPFVLPKVTRSLHYRAAIASAPGRTTLRLPTGWVGISDGALIERRETARGVVEQWEVPVGVARAFVAGPYEWSRERIDGRDILVYLLPGPRSVKRELLAQQLGTAITAQVEKLGPFPFESYGVVEIPRDLPRNQFGAASMQTFIMAQPPAFDSPGGNLQLLAHEAGHAWWANTVSSTGSARKWCGETLAEYNALIAIEALEGREALNEFLDFGRAGTDPYYCAAGYFAMLRQGRDQPIMQMGSGPGTHALANSKGVWIYHMLREKLDDETFFGVLRDVIRDHSRQPTRVSGEEMRERFINAAPDRDFEMFFSQWLDRTGAPVLETRWHARMDGSGLVLDIEQRQEGEPFVLDLDVEIETAGGERIIETIAVSNVTERFIIHTPGRPIGVRLDPDRKVLIWRPEYGPPPGEEATSDLKPDEATIAAVVGSYVFRGMNKPVEVFEREGEVYIHPDGSEPVKLLYQGGAIFQVDAPGGQMITEFDLSATPSPSFVSHEGTQSYPADRAPAQAPDDSDY